MKKMFTRITILLVALVVISSPVFSASFSEPVPVSKNTGPDPATVKAAVEEFKSLSRHERKVRLRAVKKELKNFRAEKRAGKEPKADKVIQVIFAILIPPLGVYLHEGVINNRFWIDLILTLLFWLPGAIYALIVVLGD